MLLAHSARSCLWRQALVTSTPSLKPRLCVQRRPFMDWLLNPKEDPILPKRLTPLKMDDAGSRLLFWDSTYTTPHLKPEFNDRAVSSLSTGIAHSCAVVDGNIHVWGSNYYSQVGLTTESFHDDDSEEITDVHFVSQLANEEIIQVASGNFHNMALSKTGKLWSWGSGCLGRGDEIYDSLPQPVEFFHALKRDIKQVFAAGTYSMALVKPENGDDDELYIWGYFPMGDEDDHGNVVPVMRKSLRPLLVTSVLGYNISHVACSPWHFTIAATPVADASSDSTPNKPLLMTFGRYDEKMPLEKPYSPLFLELPPEDEFYDVRPWRTFQSVSSKTDLVIKKIVASKGCDVVLMENGSIGVSDHEDHVARLIHRSLDVGILDIAGGSSEVIAVSEKGQVLAWSEPLSIFAASGNKTKDPTEEEEETDSSLLARFNLRDMSPSSLHPLLDFFKDEKKAESEVLEFFDTQRKGQEQKQRKRLVEAIFESSKLVVEKPGLSKCAAQYDRFTVC
ncbi:hypothetical protein EMPS_06481 [Entomortierella parvispora]|uniref:Uncharacterized protein n=1 Tax=Entomortierella parvispora TaxID=205924 RepID=A0A9P3LXI3_9FUNG|nr:hypothetical protein EMPS_06481 [Entomortierella parvispora]